MAKKMNDMVEVSREIRMQVPIELPEPLIQASMSRYETLNLIKALTNALDQFTI